MGRKELKNKPLVEALFEMRWELEEKAPNILIDPQYRLLLGRMYDRLGKVYPFHEELPTASVPDEISSYVTKHRFRTAENDWPLIQIGPGIITFNDTTKYKWEDFREKISQMLETFFESYPLSEKLVPNRLVLRYIDGMEFNFSEKNILDFLSDKMKTSIILYDKLFEKTGVNNAPRNIDLRFAFPSEKPRGIVEIRFARGKQEDKDFLMWETIVISSGEDVVHRKEEIMKWIDESHNLTGDWFFKIIEGELEKRFE